MNLPDGYDMKIETDRFFDEDYHFVFVEYNGETVNYESKGYATKEQAIAAGYAEIARHRKTAAYGWYITFRQEWKDVTIYCEPFLGEYKWSWECAREINGYFKTLEDCVEDLCWCNGFNYDDTLGMAYYEVNSKSAKKNASKRKS